MKIEYACGPGGCCPVQAEGFINGYPFYFRSRGEHMSLRIAKKRNGDPFKDFDAHTEQYGEDPYAAGWAETKDCEDFISRAAALILKEREGKQ